MLITHLGHLFTPLVPLPPQRTHTSAVQAWQRAESLINTNHYQPDAIRTIAENITKRWQQLVTCAEDRHKLVTSSLSFFKTAAEVGHP